MKPTTTITLQDNTGKSFSLFSPSEEASRFASLVMRRIELPRGKKDSVSTPAWPSKGGNMKRKKSATLSQRRKAWNTPALRQLGSHEKEDIAQIVFSYYATREAVKIAIDRLYNDRKALSPSDFEAMASIFRSVRKTLRMNDTASRKEDSCDHTTLQALEEMGELDITESNPSSPRLAMLNMMIAKLKAQAVEAEKNHPSRKSKAMLATHLETIDRIEALQNPFSKDCEPMEQGAWRVRIKRLASFLYPCGFQVNLGELMEDMTNLA